MICIHIRQAPMMIMHIGGADLVGEIFGKLKLTDDQETEIICSAIYLSILIEIDTLFSKWCHPFPLNLTGVFGEMVSRYIVACYHHCRISRKPARQ